MIRNHDAHTASNEFALESLEDRVLLSANPTGMTPQQVRHAYGFDHAYHIRKHVRSAADGAGR